MAPINVLTMYLMPASQVVAWVIFLTDDLYPALFKVACFYGGWAVFNVLVAGVKDLAFISFGLVAVATFRGAPKLSLAGVTLVLLNFAIPATLLLRLNAKKLGKLIRKADPKDPLLTTWALVYKLYFLSSISFWSVALYKVYRHMSS